MSLESELAQSKFDLDLQKKTNEYMHNSYGDCQSNSDYRSCSRNSLNSAMGGGEQASCGSGGGKAFISSALNHVHPREHPTKAAAASAAAAAAACFDLFSLAGWLADSFFSFLSVLIAIFGQVSNALSQHLVLRTTYELVKCA